MNFIVNNTIFNGEIALKLYDPLFKLYYLYQFLIFIDLCLFIVLELLHIKQIRYSGRYYTLSCVIYR